jgi:hypothetical protein
MTLRLKLLAIGLMVVELADETIILTPLYRLLSAGRLSVFSP